MAFYVLEGSDGVGKSAAIETLQKMCPDATSIKTPVNEFADIKRFIDSHHAPYVKLMNYMAGVLHTSEISHNCSGDLVSDRYLLSTIVLNHLINGIPLSKIESIASIFEIVLIFNA